MKKAPRMMLTIPAKLAGDLTEIAALSGVNIPGVVNVALAMHARQWNRERPLRAERDAAVDTLRTIAAGKRRTREQRLALSCVTFLDECSNVPPNDMVSGGGTPSA